MIFISGHLNERCKYEYLHKETEAGEFYSDLCQKNVILETGGIGMER